MNKEIVLPKLKGIIKAIDSLKKDLWAAGANIRRSLAENKGAQHERQEVMEIKSEEFLKAIEDALSALENLSAKFQILYLLVSKADSNDENMVLTDRSDENKIDENKILAALPTNAEFDAIEQILRGLNDKLFLKIAKVKISPLGYFSSKIGMKFPEILAYFGTEAHGVFWGKRQPEAKQVLWMKLWQILFQLTYIKAILYELANLITGKMSEGFPLDGTTAPTITLEETEDEDGESTWRISDGVEVGNGYKPEQPKPDDHTLYRSIKNILGKLDTLITDIETLREKIDKGQGELWSIEALLFASTTITMDYLNSIVEELEIIDNGFLLPISLSKTFQNEVIDKLNEVENILMEIGRAERSGGRRPNEQVPLLKFNLLSKVVK